MDNIKVGARIKSARKSIKMTQQELAQRVDRTESSIRKYEAGLIEVPNSVLEKISKVLNVSPSWLLGYNVPMERYQIIADITPEILLADKNIHASLKNATIDLLQANSYHGSFQNLIYDLNGNALELDTEAMIFNTLFERIEYDNDAHALNLRLSLPIDEFSPEISAIMQNIQSLNLSGINRLSTYLDELLKIKEYQK